MNATGRKTQRHTCRCPAHTKPIYIYMHVYTHSHLQVPRAHQAHIHTHARIHTLTPAGAPRIPSPYTYTCTYTHTHTCRCPAHTKPHSPLTAAPTSGAAVDLSFARRSGSCWGVTTGGAWLVCAWGVAVRCALLNDTSLSFLPLPPPPAPLLCRVLPLIALPTALTFPLPPPLPLPREEPPALSPFPLPGVFAGFRASETREWLCERADDASSDFECTRAPCAGSPALPLEAGAATSAAPDETGGRGLGPGDRLPCFAKYLRRCSVSSAAGRRPPAMIYPCSVSLLLRVSFPFYPF